MKILKINEWVKVNSPEYYTTISQHDGDFRPMSNKKVQSETAKKIGEETLFATDKDIAKIVNDAINSLGNNADLNFIDTSEVTDMYGLFMMNKDFNGDISKWDVSNVTSMKKTFMNSKFNGDISNWNVSNVTDMEEMFKNSQFNGDISRWDVSNVENFDFMFEDSEFNNDISGWDVSMATGLQGMFYGSRFNGDLSKWRPNNKAKMRWMFEKSKFDGDISSWNIQYEKEDERYKDMFNEFKTFKTNDMFKNSPLAMNPPKWYIPQYNFSLEETDNIPYECIGYIVSSVENFKERYQENLDFIDECGTPLKRVDPEFFKELLDAANKWLKQNNEEYTARPKDITDVFDPNANNF